MGAPASYDSDQITTPATPPVAPAPEVIATGDTSKDSVKIAEPVTPAAAPVVGD